MRFLNHIQAQYALHLQMQIYTFFQTNKFIFERLFWYGKVVWRPVSSVGRRFRIGGVGFALQEIAPQSLTANALRLSGCWLHWTDKGATPSPRTDATGGCRIGFPGTYAVGSGRWLWVWACSRPGRNRARCYCLGGG